MTIKSSNQVIRHLTLNLLLFTKINFHKPTTAKPSLFNNQSFSKFSIFGPPMFILGLLKLSNLAISTEEIYPYFQQDIGPLEPLPYSHPTSAAKHHKQSSNDYFSFTSSSSMFFFPICFFFPPTSHFSTFCCYSTFSFPLQINAFIVSKMVCNK